MLKILVADDDPNVLEPLEIALRREGFSVFAASDGIQAWDYFVHDRPDFAVLDIAMPGPDGLELTRRIGEAGDPRVPVIVLTGRDHERDKVTALDLGADDYVIKPCSHRELIARIRAVWRRAGQPGRVLSAGDLSLDPALHHFYIAGRRMEVTPIEFTLLLALIENAGQVVRANTIMRRVWGYAVSDDLLRVTVYRLRRRIEPDPKRPRYILTVPGVGFIVLDDGPSDPAPAAASPAILSSNAIL